MLHSLTYATLLDDVLHADPTTNRLEAHCASLLSHEAGVLVSSGTMGNQLAARVHLSAPPHSLLADSRSHILGYEAGAVASLSGALPIAVTPTNDRQYLTLEDITAHTVVSDDEHFAPTKLIALENTIHGAILPLAEAQAIGKWARAHGVRTHLDGARLWEAVAAQVAAGEHGGSLESGLCAYGACFDSVTVCFSKGLGAPLGSMLVGTSSFVKRARHIRKSWGGGMRQTGLIAAPAEVALRETFLGGQLVRSHEVARRVGAMWMDGGGRLIRPVETNMVWLDLTGTLNMSKGWEVEARNEGLQVYGGQQARIVCHYQICEEAVERLGKVFKRLLGGEFSMQQEGSKENGFRGYASEEKALDGDE